MDSAQQFLSDTFSKAWDTFKEDPVIYIVSAMIVGFLSAITLGILAGPLTVGFIRIVKRKHEGQAVGLGDVFDFSSFGASFGVVFIVLIAAAIGCLLLVIPGLIVLLFSTFALFEIAYRDVGTIDALQNSVRMVKERLVEVLIVTVVVWAINFVGGSVMLGALVTAPFGLILLTVAYEKFLATGSTGQPLVTHFEPPPAQRL